MFIIILFIPTVLVIIASYILHEGLQDLQEIHWKKIGAASCLLLLACISLILGIADGLSFGVFLGLPFEIIAASVSGLVLALSLPRWRKLTGLLIGIGFPFLLFISMNIGHPLDPDMIIRRNGEAIAHALNEYHTDKGIYPETLNELVPTYMDDLKEPKTMWGWLYVAEQDNFTVGYVSYIDKMGYTVCKYSRALPEWNCPMDYSTEPFHLEPTPTPDPVSVP